MELGLIYMNARYYMPSIGRFASADTVVPNPADPQSFNRYAYTLNNPVKFIDPTGHCVGDPDSGEDRECWTQVKNIDYDWNEWWERRYGSREELWRLAYMEMLDANYWSQQRLYYGESDHWSNRWEEMRANSRSSDGWDYLQAEVSGGPPLLFPAGISAAITIDRYGNVYLSLGGNAGKSWLTGVSIRAVAGELVDDDYWVQIGEVEGVPSEENLRKHLEGFSTNFGGGVGVGGGITMPLAIDWMPALMVEGGVSTPQVGFSVSYTHMVFSSD